MARRTDITPKAKPLAGEVNLFEPPPPVEVTRKTEKYLVAKSWRPDGETLTRMRAQYPLIDVDAEIVKCLEWHHTKQVKRKNWNKTVWNWLSHANVNRAGAEAEFERERRTGFKRPAHTIRAARNERPL